jgi:uncharacterized membrane protein
MIVAFPIHIVAIIVWLGGLFLLTAALRPATDPVLDGAAMTMRHAVLSRYMPWGGAALLAVIATGVFIVRRQFGGFGHVPLLHRWNMLIGIPAIALYGYMQLVTWRACRLAVGRGDWASAERQIRRVRTLAAIVLTLGLASAVVSAAARYAP